MWHFCVISTNVQCWYVYLFFVNSFQFRSQAKHQATCLEILPISIQFFFICWLFVYIKILKISVTLSHCPCVCRFDSVKITKMTEEKNRRNVWIWIKNKMRLSIDEFNLTLFNCVEKNLWSMLPFAAYRRTYTEIREHNKNNNMNNNLMQ